MRDTEVVQVLRPEREPQVGQAVARLELDDPAVIRERDLGALGRHGSSGEPDL